MIIYYVEKTTSNLYHKLIQLEEKRNLNLSNCFIFTVLVHILRRDYEE